MGRVTYLEVMTGAPVILNDAPALQRLEDICTLR
jgi:hypothetical protein